MTTERPACEVEDGSEGQQAAMWKSIVLLSLENTLNAFMARSTRELFACWKENSEMTLKSLRYPLFGTMAHTD